MANPEQAKRTRIMIMIVIVLVLILVLQVSRGGGASSTSSSSGNMLDRMVGVDLKGDFQKFENARDKRDLIQKEKKDFQDLENQLLEDQEELWLYTKSGTPKGTAQQKILRLAKDMGISSPSIDYGSERNLSGCEYLKYIDYNISSRGFDLKSLANFMDAIDKDTKKFHWKDLRIYKSSKGLAFSGSIRIYVLNKKAIALLGKK